MNIRFLKLMMVGLMIGGISQLLSAQAQEQEKGGKAKVVRELKVKGLGIPQAQGTKVTDPAVLDSEADIKQAFPSKEAQGAVLRQVDLTKEYILFFHWAGSGQDRVTPQVKKDGEKTMVLFSYRPGLTRDLRQHAKVFAIEKGVAFKVQRVPFKRGG